MFSSLKDHFKGDNKAQSRRNEELQGFICPMCMVSFDSPEKVQQHFDSVHPEQLETQNQPAPQPATSTADPVTAADLVSPTTNRRTQSIQGIQHNINDLQQSLEEEKWYSKELQKEISRLTVLAADKDSDAEKQIKTSEDLNSRISNAETENSQMREDLRKLQMSRDSLLQENKTIRSDFEKFEKNYHHLDKKTRDQEMLITELQEGQHEQETISCPALVQDQLRLEIVDLREDLHKLQVTTSQEQSVLSTENKNLQLKLASVREESELKVTDLESQLQIQRKLCDETEAKAMAAARKNKDIMEEAARNTALLTEKCRGWEDEQHRLNNLIQAQKDDLHTTKQSLVAIRLDLEVANERAESLKKQKEDLQSQVQLSDVADIVVGQLRNENTQLAERERQLAAQLEDQWQQQSHETTELKSRMTEIQDQLFNAEGKLRHGQENSRKREEDATRIANEQSQQLEELQKMLLASKEQHEHELNEQSKKLKKKVDEGQLKIVDNEKHIDHLKSELAVTLEKLNESDAYVVSFREEVLTKQVDIDDLHTQCADRLRQLEETNAKVQTLHTEFDQSEAALRNEALRLSETKTALYEISDQLKSRDIDLEQENKKVVEITIEKTRLEKLSCELEKSIVVLNTRLQEGELQRTIMEDYNKKCKAQVESLSVSESAANSCNADLIDNEKLLRSTIDSLKDEHDKELEDLRTIRAQLDQLNSNYSESVRQENETKNILDQTEEKVVQLSYRIEELETELSKLRERATEDASQATKTEKQLRNQLETLEKTFNESSQSLSQMKLDAANAEITLRNTNDELSTEKELLRAESLRLAEDLDTEKSLRETELANMTEKITRLTEKLTLLEMNQSEHRETAERAETDLIENKLRLETAIEEKEKMIEKIIGTEDALKRQQDIHSKKCCELEQLQMAILDLGRENQSLQITRERLVQRQWIPDTSASDCHRCGAVFSLTVRKHHCRQCGLVFCAACSNRSAPLAVSRTPVRVCDQCHTELHSHRAASTSVSASPAPSRLSITTATSSNSDRP